MGLLEGAPLIEAHCDVLADGTQTCLIRPVSKGTLAAQDVSRSRFSEDAQHLHVLGIAPGSVQVAATQRSGTTDANLAIHAGYRHNLNTIWIQQTPVPVVILLYDRIVKDFSYPIIVWRGRFRLTSVTVT